MNSKSCDVYLKQDLSVESMEDLRETLYKFDKDQLVDFAMDLTRLAIIDRDNYHKSRRQIYGPKNEQMIPLDLGLDNPADEPEAILDETDPDLLERQEHQLGKQLKEKKKKRGRNGAKAKLDPNKLPVDKQVDIYPDSPEFLAVKDQCKELKPSIINLIEHVPAQLKVNRWVCHNYVYEDQYGESHFFSASEEQKPAKPFGHSPLGVSTAVHFACDKINGLPLHRQEKLYRENGLAVSKNIMSNALIRLGEIYQPVADRLKKELQSQDVVHIDETSQKVIQVTQEGGNIMSTVVVACSGEFEKHQVFTAVHRPDKKQEFVFDVLGDSFSGAFETDANPAYGNYPCGTHLGCNVHARRKFVDALKEKSNYKAYMKLKTPEEREAFLELPQNGALKISIQPVLRYQELYKIEKRCREEGLSPEQITRVRQEESFPVWNQLVEQCQAVQDKYISGSVLHKAASYFLDHEKELSRFLENGLYPLDNNRAERGVKTIVLSRKNYQKCKTSTGAICLMNHFTLKNTAELNGLFPEKYMTWVGERLVSEKMSEELLESLLPWSPDVPDEIKRPQ